MYVLMVLFHMYTTYTVSLRKKNVFFLSVHCSTPLFLTPPLVSPKFSHVPLGVGGWPLGYEERRCWANCQLSLQVVSNISNLGGHDPPTSRTDGWIDRWTDDMRMCRDELL